MRSRFLVKAIALCAVVSSAAFAQQSTARIDALSKTLIYKDPWLMLNDPVEMFYYQDIIQATYDGSVGPIFATRRLKSAENIMIGFIANRTDNAWEDFYTSAFPYTGDMSATGSGMNQMPNVPHLLFGLDLEFMKIGLDLNYEFARHRFDSERIDTGAGITTETIVDVNQTVGTPGVKLSSDILLGDLKLGVGGELAFPSVNSFRSDEVNRNGDLADGTVSRSLLEWTTREESGIRVGGFADITAELFDITWKTGVGIVYDTYRFETDTTKEQSIVGSPDTTFDTSHVIGSSQDSRMVPYFWLGGLKEIQPGLVGGFSYRFKYELDKTVPDSLAQDLRIKRDLTLQNQIRAGIEKTWQDCWRFDEVFARAGLDYDISTFIPKETSDGEQKGESFESRRKNRTTFSEMNFTLGSGIRKGIFLFDFVVNKDLLINFIPIITGANPSGGAFAKFTITLDFKHRTADCCPKPCEGGSSMMRSTPASTPSYGGEAQTEEPDMDFGF